MGTGGLAQRSLPGSARLCPAPRTAGQPRRNSPPPLPAPGSHRGSSAPPPAPLPAPRARRTPPEAAGRSPEPENGADGMIRRAQPAPRCPSPPPPARTCSAALRLDAAGPRGAPPLLPPPAPHSIRSRPAPPPALLPRLLPASRPRAPRLPRCGHLPPRVSRRESGGAPWEGGPHRGRVGCAVRVAPCPPGAAGGFGIAPYRSRTAPRGRFRTARYFLSKIGYRLFFPLTSSFFFFFFLDAPRQLCLAAGRCWARFPAGVLYTAAFTCGLRGVLMLKQKAAAGPGGCRLLPG